MLSFSFIVFSNFSSDFFPDPLGIWEYSPRCTFSHVYILPISFCYSFPGPLHYGQRGYFVWFKNFQIYWDLFCSLKVKVLVAQSRPTLCIPMDCSLPGCSVYGILHARILEWVTKPFSRGSFQPRYRTQVSCISGRFFTIWTTWEAHFCSLPYGLSGRTFHVH